MAEYPSPHGIPLSLLKLRVTTKATLLVPSTAAIGKRIQYLSSAERSLGLHSDIQQVSGGEPRLRGGIAQA